MNDREREDRAMSTSTRRHLIATVMTHEVAGLEPAIAAELFAYDYGPMFGVEWYEHTFCTEHPGRLRVSRGMDVFVDEDFGVLRRADTIVIPGWGRSQRPSPALTAELRAAHERGARLVSFCTGAFALAAAGLLDGRRATTHWSHAEEFASTYPDVEFDPSVLYVHDDRILTAAGSASCIDLGLYIIRQDYGAEIANLVARDLVVPPHRDGGQAQYITTPMPSCPQEDPLSDTLGWALEHLDEPLTLEVLAARAMMSSRNFSRRFTAATGTTPHKWVVHQRVAAAQGLLETTTLPIEVIADRCGFGSAASLRAQFQQTVRSSPQAYRRAFARPA